MCTAVILIGIPASGKSTFYLQRFFTTHVRINRDMLRTPHREKLLLQACLDGRQSFVIDNTNATKAARQRFIIPARNAGFIVTGYYLSSRLSDAVLRNRQRTGTARIPDGGVRGIAGTLELPELEEGFHELWYVGMDGCGGFIVDPWRPEQAPQKDIL